MRKLLLFVCAVITSISVNAQEKEIGKNYSMEKLQSKLVCDMKDVNFKTSDTNIAKAPSTDKVAGNYIEDNYLNFHECSDATITAIDGNKFKIAFATGYAEIEGTYDPATGIITCGEQECGSYTNTNTGVTFNFTIKGISQLDLDNGKLYTTNELSFTVEDDGSISINQEGYFIEISGCTDANNIGKTWTWNAGTKLMPVNGKMEGRRNIVGETGWIGWQNYSIPVAIEDFEYSVNVYNICAMGCASIDINDDGTVSMATGQIMKTVPTSHVETYGEYFTIKGVGVDGQGYMFVDKTMTDIKGTISGNTITFDNIFINCSDLTEDGYGLFDGYYGLGSTITLNEGNYTATGIEEIGVTREEKIKNTKTYNLMGQQVNRATAKGLLIRDGKKYIKKN